MSDWLVNHEPEVRLSCFFGVLCLMAIWELVAPRRTLTASKTLRWASNLGIVMLNTILLRLLFPAAAMGMALLAAERHWGLFNNIDLPAGLEVIAAVVALDFAIYLQHVMFHAVPAFWRLHRVHHADLDIDVTTGARFHPIEIVLSLLIKFAVITALGPAPLAVLIFEVLLNATAMFNHSNVRIPLGIDRVLRWLVVTPDMHRVHHSIEAHETNSNFGFNLPFWDRLFGTYKAQPDAGHEGMTIGIRDLRAPRLASALPGMLWLPFVGKISDYAINRRTWKKNP